MSGQNLAIFARFSAYFCGSVPNSTAIAIKKCVFFGFFWEKSTQKAEKMRFLFDKWVELWYNYI
jgi:hypothetical protein